MYEVLKSIHIISVIVFLVGMTLMSAILPAHNYAALHAVRRWDRRVTSPALLLVWLTGMCVALEGHWFEFGWLQLKLVFVALLSMLHSILAGTTRRLITKESGMAPTLLCTCNIVCTCQHNGFTSCC
jgi:uncharacterized membrane protein